MTVSLHFKHRGNSNDTDLDPNATASPLPVLTTKTPPTTIQPAEEIPEPPEVEQHSSMTIFFILLVVGMSSLFFLSYFLNVRISLIEFMLKLSALRDKL